MNALIATHHHYCNYGLIHRPTREMDLNMVSEKMAGLMENLLTFKNRIRSMPVDDFRARMDKMASLIQVPRDEEADPVDAGGVPAFWVGTPGADADHVIFQIHDGDLHRWVCQQ